MTNNTALFVTHSIFLTKDQVHSLDLGEMVEVVGHSVPVWVDAATGKTTEPGEEIFCLYRINNSKNSNRSIELLPRLGYEVFVPENSGWSLPKFDTDKISEWSSEKRMSFLREVEEWSFMNPKPHDIANLKNGYMRFELRKNIGESNKNPEHHVVEIAEISRLAKSLV